MTRVLSRPLRSLAAVVMALFLTGLLVEAAQAEGFESDPPSETTSDTMGDHEEGSENPDSMLTGSEDPDASIAHSEDPDDMVTGSEDPDSMVEGAQQLDAHEGHAYGEQNLKESAPDAGAVPIEMEGQASWTATNDPKLITARRELVRAQERARAADTRYGNMIRTQYPTGAAREEIVRERDEAMAALEAAKQKVRDLQGSPASSW